MGPTSSTSHLDGNYTVFGKVIEGMDVVTIISKLPKDAREWPLKNVTIKTSAGVANVVKRLLSSQVFLDAASASEDGSAAKLMRILSDQINPHRFNGASLLGLKGSIIKSHGNATIEGFAYAIQQAVREAENAVPELIRGKVAAIIAAS